MGRLIEEKTNGRLQIRVFHSRQLGEEKETIEQTSAGAIDLNRTNVALIGSFVPAMNVLAMPFLFRSIEHLQKVLDGPIGDEILGSFEPYGFVGLAFYDSGARSIYNSVRPIRSIADMKGLRLRVQQSELMSDMIRALGAEPIELPYGQVRTGLATKLVDGAENNWPSFVTTDHYKYAGFYTLTEHTMSPEVLVMSHKAWTSLSTEDQAIFHDAARQSSRFMRERWKDLEEQSRRQAQSGRRDRRERLRPQAVRSGDGWPLRQGQARSGRSCADRTNPQGRLNCSRKRTSPRSRKRPRVSPGAADSRLVALVRAVPIRWRILSIAALNSAVVVVLVALIWNGVQVLGSAWDDVRQVRESDKILARPRERNRPSAKPDPSLHQPAEPGNVRRDLA